MSNSVRIERLQSALGDYGRNIREFTWTALARNEDHALEVLRQLGDPARLTEPDYREQLAKDVVSEVTLYTEQMAERPDRYLRCCAEAVLALKGFHGMPVGKRKGRLDDCFGVTEDMYKRRRPMVLNEVSMHLVRTFDGGQRGLVSLCLCGSYVGETWDSYADAFGRGLVGWPVALVSGYARPGQVASRAMGERLAAKGIHDSTRIVQYARDVKGRGSFVGFAGLLDTCSVTQEDKRYKMIPGCRLAVLFAGGEGTAEEARIAEQYRIPLLPLGFTGGAAQRYWKKGLATVGQLFLGGYQVDPVLSAQLGHKDTGIPAALALIEQAITATAASSVEARSR